MENNKKTVNSQGVELSSWDRFIDPAQESQRMLSTLIGNLPGVVYRCINDKRYTMLFVSKRVKEIFGFEPEDVINNKKYSFAEFIHPEDRDRIWDETQMKLKYKKSFLLDYRIIDLNGNIKWIWEQGVGVFNKENRLLGLEGFMIDITDKINLEKNLEKTKNLALLGEFSSALAHQVRNPLGDCLLSAKLMQDLLKTMELEENNRLEYNNLSVLRKDLRNQLKKDLVKLIEGIDGINSIVTQILNYTKSMKLMFSKQRIDILLKDMLSPYKDLIEKQNIEIVIYIESGISKIEIDAILISQAFQNLIDNAIKLMKNGGYIKINVNKINYLGECLLITIADSGPGVNEDDKKNLFKPFYTTRTSGTGLGLSFAKRVIEAHNGEIWLCSPDKCIQPINQLCGKCQELNGKRLPGAAFHIILPVTNTKKPSFA